MFELQEIRDKLSDKEVCLIRSNEREEILKNEIQQKDIELNETKKQRQVLKQHIFDMNNVVMKIRDFKKLNNKDIESKENILCDEELNILIEMLNFCHNDIVNRLIALCPDLSKDDLHLCCLLSLNVPNKKIAVLLNTNENALKQRKWRIKHSKFCIEENITLEDYLENLKTN